MPRWRCGFRLQAEVGAARARECVMHDVVIAGAGPAGAIAATVLARAGVRVLRARSRAVPPRQALWRHAQPRRARDPRRGSASRVAAGGALPLDGMIVTGATGVRVEGATATHPGRVDLRVAGSTWRSSVAASDAGAEIEEGVLVQEASVDTSGRSAPPSPDSWSSGGTDVMRRVRGADGDRRRRAVLARGARARAVAVGAASPPLGHRRLLPGRRRT